MPNAEEAQQLNGYENEKNLGVAENFVKIIRSVDGDLVQRLSLWEFKIEFDELYETEQDKIFWLRRGHDAIRNSDGLRIMFTLILSIGNYMNGSTAKGQAYGFKLNSLTQLLRSRTVDNSATLLEYIYEFITKQGADSDIRNALNFTKELQSLDEAQTVDVSVLRQNICRIGLKLKLIRKRIENKSTITRMNDEFISKMAPFYERSIEKFKKLEKVRDEMFADLKALGIWLNEPKDTNFKFLKTLNEFRQNFQMSIKLVELKKKKMAEIEKRKQWKQNKKNKKKKLKCRNQGNVQLSDRKDISLDIIVQKQQKQQNVRKRKDSENGSDSVVPMPPVARQKSLEDRDQNISDVVIEQLAGSEYNFIERLRNRAKHHRQKSNHK